MATTGPIRLFGIGQRGVDVVNKPQDLDESELVSGQNVEIGTNAGAGALDQRAGMTRIGNTAASGAIVTAFDVPADLLTDHTPYLYAGLTSGATGGYWRRTTNGSTWSNVTGPTGVAGLPSSSNPVYYKNIPKTVTVGRYLYFFDRQTPYNVHRWDGTSDLILSSIPPAIAGAALATPDSSNSIWNNGGVLGGTTYAYKVVAVNGANHSPASTGLQVPNPGPANLSATGYNIFTGTPVAGSTSYDVYRTVGGATQGKVGSVPIMSGAFTLGNGGPSFPFAAFTDDGLVADGSTAPATGVGAASPTNAVAVIDVTTDGASIYCAVVDVLSGSSTAGRILRFSPGAGVWTQILAEFPVTASQGTAGTLINWDGALNYGTMVDTATGAVCSMTTTRTPNYVGGIPENHTGASNLVPTCMASFDGALFVGTALNSGTGSALVVKRLPLTASGTWSTALTATGGTGAKCAFTSFGQFNGRLFAGWCANDGATTGAIYSTADGVTWANEFAPAATEVVCQMANFSGCLYVVLGTVGASGNTASRIVQRTVAGTWTTADNPTDDYCGALGVVYI